jgi:pimeloyl-ACP methyl ester carboxylesterase
MQRFIKKIFFTSLSILLLTITSFSQSEKRNHNSEPKTIVLIHGLFQNSHSWAKWKVYFEEKGFKVYSPSYPYHEGDPKFLNSNVDPKLINLDFKQVLDYMTAFVDSLPEKPIIIGHSIGGLVAQKLVEAQKASMAIALAPANPRGISVLDWKYIRSNFRMVNPFKRRDRICTPPMKWFRYTFFNTISDSLAQIAHNNYFVPESRIIARSSTKKGLEIDFSKPHVPMLFVSGENDNDLPPSLILKNYLAYHDKNSVKSYYEFPKKSHYIVSEPGWEEVADYVHKWIETNAQKN